MLRFVFERLVNASRRHDEHVVLFMYMHIIFDKHIIYCTHMTFKVKQQYVIQRTLHSCLYDETYAAEWPLSHVFRVKFNDYRLAESVWIHWPIYSTNFSGENLCDATWTRTTNLNIYHYFFIFKKKLNKNETLIMVSQYFWFGLFAIHTLNRFQRWRSKYSYDYNFMSTRVKC